jgi:hypothetical protein
MSEKLAAALESLAAALQNHPSSITAQKVSAVAGPGSSGTVIGMKATATAGPGSSGTVIGNMAIASSGQRNPADAQLVLELAAAAAAVRKKEAPRPWISGLIDRAGSLGNAALNAAVTAAASALATSALK